MVPLTHTTEWLQLSTFIQPLLTLNFQTSFWILVHHTRLSTTSSLLRLKCSRTTENLSKPHQEALLTTPLVPKNLVILLEISRLLLIPTVPPVSVTVNKLSLLDQHSKLILISLLKFNLEIRSISPLPYKTITVLLSQSPHQFHPLFQDLLLPTGAMVTGLRMLKTNLSQPPEQHGHSQLLKPPDKFHSNLRVLSVSTMMVIMLKLNSLSLLHSQTQHQQPLR